MFTSARMSFQLTGCATVAFLGLSAGVVAAQPFTTTASIRETTGVVADNRVCRTRSDNLLETVPDMTLEFVQGGTTARSVAATFVANWPRPLASDLPAGSVRAGAFILMEIDGLRVDMTSDFGGVLVHEGTASSVSNGTHGFTFVTEPLAPGPHTARIRWWDNVLPFTPATICVQERSLTILHR